MYESGILWIIFQTSGWLILLCLGMLFQNRYYPSLLFREEAINIGIFFRFSLGNKITIDDILEEKQKITKRKYELKVFEYNLNNDRFSASHISSTSFKDELDNLKFTNNRTEDLVLIPR